MVRDNLEWFIGGTAVAALFIGGLLAGWLSGVRGAGSGFFNGITMWGLILIVAVAVGLPAVFNILNLGPVTSISDEGGLIGTGVDDTLWATFLTILGGFLASGLGGLIGGASPCRPTPISSRSMRRTTITTTPRSRCRRPRT